MFKTLCKSEKGSVTVLVALTMTVLLGFTSLAVDYGSLTNERSKLQNAADAAALAGIVKGQAAAVDYVLKNTTGVDEADIKVEQPTANTMKVSIKKNCDAFFSQVLTGKTSNQVAADATAKFTGDILMPEYAIWAEHKVDLDNKSNINGSVHSNHIDEYDIHKGSTITNGVIDGLNGAPHEVQPIPDYRYLIDLADPIDLSVYIKNLTGISPGSSITMTQDIMNALDSDRIYKLEAESTITIPSSVYYNINLITNGPVIFQGSGAGGEAKILYTTHPDGVTFHGSSGTLRALVYVPNGDVTARGSDTDFVGSVICQNFIQSGAKGTVKYDAHVADNFVKRKPKLID